MRKKIDWKWEELDESTKRVKVIGGWLVLHVKTFSIKGGKNNSDSQSESMQFVADRDHEWTIVQAYVESKPAESKVSAADFESTKY